MKKLFYLFLFLSMFLLAENNIILESFMLLKTKKNFLSLSTITEKSALFESIDDSKNTLLSPYTVSWIKITLNPNLPSNKYFVSYKGFEFEKSSFSTEQKLNKYISNATQVFSFEYQTNRDKREYYLKLFPITHYTKPSIKIQLFNDYYQDAILKPDSRGFFLLFGVIIGLILMVVVYNFTIYFYTKKNSFFYYACMEILMIFIMIYQFGIQSLDTFFYNSSTLLSSLFGTLFIREFLNTAKYLSRLDKVLQLYLLLLLLDWIHLFLRDYSLFSYFSLYAIFALFYFIVAFLRLKQGFTPAKFFLIGWFFLVLSIFMTEHMGSVYGFSPFLFGPPLEAIFLAMALAYKLKLELDEKKEQKDLLIHQSKLACMGEMIGNIAHQWKQPLTYLSFNFMNLKEASKRNILDDEYLNKKLDKANAQLDFMAQTIDNFKDFYLPNKDKQFFSLKEATLETVEVLSYQFKEEGVEVVLDIKEDTELHSYKNEYKQVLLNLLSNAKDAFIRRRMANPKIITIIFKHNSVELQDNAGGIPSQNLKYIFDPYFSTKKDSSGIGLYMSKMIIEKDMNGLLTVENGKDGAIFKILF